MSSTSDPSNASAPASVVTASTETSDPPVLPSSASNVPSENGPTANTSTANTNVTDANENSKSSSGGSHPSGNTGVASGNNTNQVYAQYSNHTEVQHKISSAVPLSPIAMHPPNMHAYYYQQQVPNSPATPSVGNVNSQGSTAGGYDVQSLLGQNSNNVFMRGQYPIIPPLSPAIGGNGDNMNSGGGGEQAGGNMQGQGTGQDMNLSMGTVPPASPLFPGAPSGMFPDVGVQHDNNSGVHGPGVGVNMGVGRSMVTPNSPSLQYLGGPPPSPVISYGGMYPPSPDIPLSWSDRTLQQQQMYPPSTPTPSPHLQSIQYQQSQNRRTTSFDGEFLPSSALEPDSTSAVYATSVFSAQQPWGYNTGAGGPPPSSPYTQQNQQNSHPQLRSPPRGRQGRGSGGPPGGGQQAPPNFYPAATPGPPIQTTHHNKGPEGANLFIFHIPNHFTNLDMWHLFCHYGNLLSVRIMVEKDTGRSRGFGFVSYDSPDAAALAIKELNGFVIGNKRLKVQHKQIRQGEMNLQHDHVNPPPIYSESNAHATSYVNQHLHSQSDLTGGHQVGGGVGSQGAAFGLAPSSEGEAAEHKPVKNPILNLDSIGEALSEVSK